MFKQHVNLLIWTLIFVNSYTNRVTYASLLRSTSRKIKSKVNVISQMRRPIFQYVKVLINHKMSYSVSLWYLCELILCWIDAPINIRSLIKWWLHFDVIDGSWFFSAWNLYHICHITNIFYRRMMQEEDEKPLNEKSQTYHFSISYNGCEICLLYPPAILALPKCLFKRWRLWIRDFICLRSCSRHCNWNCSILHKDEHKKMRNIRTC